MNSIEDPKDAGRPPADRPSHGLRSSLVALSAAAVLTVYAAGYARTRAAAARFDNETADRRPASRPTFPPASPADHPHPSASIPAAPHDRQQATSPPFATVPPSPTSDLRPPTSDPSTVHRPTAVHRLPSASPSPNAVTSTRTDSTTAPAPVSTPTAPTIDTTAPAKSPTVDSTAKADTARTVWKDGTYTGWGSSRHGDIQASVEISDGRIVSATITQCLTRYSCSWIAALPGQVVARQSPETDYVSGATQSTNAFYYAVVEALSKAK